MANELTKTEQKQHARDMAIVARNMGSFVETGQALARIRDGRTYRETHETFEAFCKETWEFSKGQLYRLIDSSSVMDRLGKVSNWRQTQPILPANEAQARPLTTIDMEQGAEDRGTDPTDATLQRWQAALWGWAL